MIKAFTVKEGATMIDNIKPGTHWFSGLHHLVSFNSNKENCNAGLLFTTSCATQTGSAQFWYPSAKLSRNPFGYTSHESGMESDNSCIVVISFCLSRKEDSYLRVLHSQNPVEPFTTPY